MKKYTLIEFLAAQEGENFDELDNDWVNHFKNKLPKYITNNEADCTHHGDCTKAPYTCGLCLLENHLKDYKEYIFNEEQWRKDNL